MQADSRQAVDDLLAVLGAEPAATDAAWLPGLREVRATYDRKLAVMAGEMQAVMPWMRPLE